MKHKHLFSLLDTNFTLARVVFDDGSLQRRPAQRPERQPRLGRTEVSAVLASGVEPVAPWSQDTRDSYQYKVPKLWGTQVDDRLVVDTPYGMKVARVVEVDPTGAIDPDADHTYRYAVQKVDTTEYDVLVKREADFQATMLQVERTAQREEAAAKYRAHLPEGSESLRIFNDAVAAIAGHTVEGTPQPPRA